MDDDKTIKEVIFDSVVNFSDNKELQVSLLYYIAEKLKEAKIL